MRTAHPTRRRVRPTGDRGGIVLGWLVRLAVVLAVLGVTLFDALSIGTSRLAVQDQGVAAARAGAVTWGATHDLQAAYVSSVTAAIEAHDLNDVPPASFRIAQDGAVSLTVRREARTFLVQRLPWTAAWAEVSADVTGDAGG